MKILLLRYLKVTNEAFEKIASSAPSNLYVVQDDLASFGSRMDVLSYEAVDDFLSKHKPLDAIMVGDIFWATGQNICKWCLENKILCFFLQHGQWIYTVNKKNPPFLPSHTLLMGENIANACRKWPYARRSRITAVGSPRYNDLKIEPGKYVYFSPPALLEKVPSGPNRTNSVSEKLLPRFRGLDKVCNLLIHPHYREGKVNALKWLFPGAQFADVQDSALSLIAQSGRVLTHRDSTVVLDAIACRKQTVLIFDFPSFYPKGYFKEFAIESNSFNDCVNKLHSNIRDIVDYEKKAAEFLILGNASKRISDIVLNAV